MKFLLLLRSDDQATGTATPETVERLVAAFDAYDDALQKAGVMRGRGRLRPAAEARIISIRDGETQVLDGPYADSREQVGGFIMIEVASEDEALAWAARCPLIGFGTIELRPLWAD